MKITVQTCSRDVENSTTGVHLIKGTKVVFMGTNGCRMVVEAVENDEYRILVEAAEVTTEKIAAKQAEEAIDVTGLPEGIAIWWDKTHTDDYRRLTGTRSLESAPL